MLPASCGQALDTQERTAKPLALGCFAAQVARHDMEPHGHASAQASPPLQLGSARQALISAAQCCSPHVHFAGQAVLLQSGNVAGISALAICAAGPRSSAVFVVVVAVVVVNVFVVAGSQYMVIVISGVVVEPLPTQVSFTF